MTLRAQSLVWLCAIISVSLSLQIKKLDDSEFRNAFSRAYVRV